MGLRARLNWSKVGEHFLVCFGLLLEKGGVKFCIIFDFGKP